MFFSSWQSSPVFPELGLPSGSLFSGRFCNYLQFSLILLQWRLFSVVSPSPSDTRSEKYRIMRILNREQIFLLSQVGLCSRKVQWQGMLTKYSCILFQDCLFLLVLNFVLETSNSAPMYTLLRQAIYPSDTKKPFHCNSQHPRPAIVRWRINISFHEFPVMLHATVL